jgi:hypothetical protein
LQPAEDVVPTCEEKNVTKVHRFGPIYRDDQGALDHDVEMRIEDLIEDTASWSGAPRTEVRASMRRALRQPVRLEFDGPEFTDEDRTLMASLTADQLKVVVGAALTAAFEALGRVPR